MIKNKIIIILTRIIQVFQRVYSHFICKNYCKEDQVLYKNEYVNYKLGNNDVIDIITIAFNNKKSIEYQIKCLKEFFMDQYFYTVVDNSTNKTISDDIKYYCNINHIAYIRLKPNNNKGSDNHGTALNYVYYNYLSKRNAKYIALIDHDIYPIKEFSIKKLLDNQNYWGYMKYEKLLYLWPGLSFFRLDYLKNKKIDFLTNWPQGGDTGSSNYKVIYLKDKKRILNHELEFADFQRFNIFEGSSPQDDMYSIMGGWLHMLNGSNWKKSLNFLKKEEKIYSLIDKIINNHKTNSL